MSRQEPETFDPGEYWETRLSQQPDLKGVGFISLGRSFNVWMYRVRRHVFDRTAQRYVRPLSQAAVVDLGSGTGFYVERWRTIGAGSVQAVDITKSSAALLKERFPDVDIHVGDITSAGDLEGMGLTPASFDAVSCMDVLFHVVDDERYERAIANVASLLRPEGIFILSDNCLHGDEIRLDHHVSRTLADVSATLRQQGFEMLSRRSMLYFMNAPVDAGPERVLRWERRFARLTRREWMAWLVGALLYPLERVMVSRCAESPTTEILVCRKTS
jgi:SAM-dependent methyltransferase